MAYPPDLGYLHELFILPFDHRGSFEEKLFVIHGRPPSPAEVRKISSYKRVIFEAFKSAIKAGVPKDKAGILVDEQFGSEILVEAKAQGFATACPVEKSGQEEFDFEYGPEFGAHINKFKPTFAKVLVRYNPAGNPAMNRRQLERLLSLSDYCHSHGTKLMFELLVIANAEQIARVGGDICRYDRELRPNLMIQALQQIQSAGIEPDVWKVEGMDEREDYLRVAKQARTDGRKNVGVIVLGRGESIERVKHWLNTAVQVPGLVGFAVGRTLFWEALTGLRDGKWGQEKASELIARHFKEICDLWWQSSH